MEIITVSGHDLNQAYSGRQKCPMLKCFHTSATPMEQIYHVATCTEACKGEIQCWTCQKCHEFKKWHLKSPVELLRRLSNRKRGSNTSASEPFAPKRGKVGVDDDFTIPSRQESHGVESVWPPEMEDPTSFLLPEIASTPNPALELDAEANHIPLALQPRDFHAAKPLPTPPSTRDHSWSEDSQNLVAYGDAKVAHVPEQPPPYIVSPQTTVDDYQRHDNPTDSLRLGIPPVQYIHESTFMESPEDMEFPEADQPPWARHAVFREAEDPQVDLRLVPNVPGATASAQYGDPSENTAPIFSSSFTDSRMPNPRMQKQNTWPMQLDCSNNTPRPPPFNHQQRQTLDDISDLFEQDVSATTASQQNIKAGPSVGRQASFDIGAQDSIAVSAAPEDEHQAPARRGAGEQGAVQKHTPHRQYEECGRCGQRFRGIPKNRRQHLKRHVASKHGDVRFRCAHPGCRRSYNREDNLHDHERKCHGFVLLHQFEGAGGGDSEMAELAADDVEITCEGGAPAAAAEGSAEGIGHQESSAMETHLAVFGYSISSEEGHGWHRADDDTQDLGARRTVGLTAEEWHALMAGVSGGQHEEDEARVPDVGHDGADTPEDGLSMRLGLAPRPLDLPCASWRVLGG